MPTLSSHRVAILLAIAAFFCFSVLNACVKHLGMLGYDPFQVAFFNALVALVALGSWQWWRLRQRGGLTAWLDSLRMPLPWLAGYLSLGLIACACLFTAFGQGVFPVISAIVAAAPLLVATFSSLFLKERLNMRQAMLIIAGFVGVLIIARPTDFSVAWPVYLAIAGVMAYAGTLTLVRARHGKVDVVALTLCFFTAIVAVMPFLMDARPLTPLNSVFFIIGGVADAAGLALLYSALMRAPASVVSPFEYSIVLWAGLLGYFIWGEVPDLISSLGIATVVVAGLLFVRTEKTA